MPTVTGTTTTVSGLVPGTQYQFRVRARNAVGYSDYSPWSAPGTPTGTPQPPVTLAGESWTLLTMPLARTLDVVNGFWTAVGPPPDIASTEYRSLWSCAAASENGVDWFHMTMPVVTLHGNTANYPYGTGRYVPTSYAYGNGVYVGTGCVRTLGAVVVSTSETLSTTSSWSVVLVGANAAAQMSADTADSSVFFDGNRFLLRTGTKMWSSTTGFSWTEEPTYKVLHAYATLYDSPSAAIWRDGGMKRSSRPTGPSYAMPSLASVTAVNPDSSWGYGGANSPFGVPYDNKTRFYMTGNTWVWQRKKMFNYALNKHVAGGIGALNVGVGSSTDMTTSILPEPFCLANTDSYLAVRPAAGVGEGIPITLLPRSVASRANGSTLALATNAPDATSTDPAGRWLLRRPIGSTSFTVLQTLPMDLRWYDISCGVNNVFIATGNNLFSNRAYYSTGS